jgi:hypothetical protein
MGNEDSVADFELGDFSAYFLNDARSFMPENSRSLWNAVPFCHVTSADAASHHFQQEFVSADFRRWHFLDSYVFIVVIDGCKQTGFT